MVRETADKKNIKKTSNAKTKTKKVADKKSATKNKKITKAKKVYTKEEILQKQKKIKNIFWIIVSFSIILGIGIFLCTSDTFKIKEIHFSGNVHTLEEDFQIYDKIDKNIFVLTNGKIASDIKKNPYVKNVKIKKILPNKLEITIEERTTSFMLKSENGYMYIDSQGYVLEESKVNLEKPIIIGYDVTQIQPGQRLNDKNLKILEDILKIMDNSKQININDKITSIQITNDNEYVMYLKDMKKVVYIGNMNNLLNKMLFTKGIIEKAEGKEGKIFVNGDFSDGFQAYFREEPNQMDI